VSASEQENPERARLHELMAVSEAERAVADVRTADLAAAQERERQAYAEAAAVADAGIDEMFVINRAGLERFGEILEAIGPAWAADPPQPGRDVEAGQ
jgi:hypothetical protein